jgi:hypothetical protein
MSLSRLLLLLLLMLCRLLFYSWQCFLFLVLSSSGLLTSLTEEEKGLFEGTGEAAGCGQFCYG